MVKSKSSANKHILAVIILLLLVAIALGLYFTQNFGASPAGQNGGDITPKQHQEEQENGEEQTYSSGQHISSSEAHKLIQGCHVKAYEGSNLHLKSGVMVTTDMPPHDLVETIDNASPPCGDVENLDL